MSIAEQLRQRRRELKLPAELALAGGERVVCEAALRVLPGRRAVMKARWRGRSALVKVMVDSARGRRGLRRELAGHRWLRDANIATPELLLSARDDDGAHVLLFEFVERAQRLGDRWRSAQELQVAAAGINLIARLHQAGCCHADPHLDNFLQAANKLYVIDAAAVTHHADLGYGDWQRANLALFIAQFPPRWRAALFGLLDANYPAAADDRKLEDAVERASRRRTSSYLKKCFRESSEFCARRNFRRVAGWKRVHQSDDLADFLQRPDDWMKKGELLKDGNSATVVRVEMNGRAVVIKRNNLKNRRWWWRHCLRPTRSHLNWRNAHLLKICGVATPAPIAFVERRRGPLRLQGYYVCAYCDFPSAAKKFASAPPTEQELARIKELFAAMQCAWLYHGDFKASNLLVTDDGVALIDLDAVKQCASPREHTRLFDKDRVRFLRNWDSKPEQQKMFAEIFEQRVKPEPIKEQTPSPASSET